MTGAPGPKNLKEAYLSLGLNPDRRPGHVVNRRHGQVLLHLGLIDRSFVVEPIALWSDGTSVQVVDSRGEFHPEVTPSAELHIYGGAAVVLDMMAQISRMALERIEDVDRGLAELEQDPLHAPLLRVLELKRKVAIVREELGRAITGLSDLVEGRVLTFTGGPPSSFQTMEQELLRLRDLTQATQSGLTDIFMIRQTDQANQLQMVANRMAAVSNRIAELSNISNIRMLGLSYVTLILAVVATVVLFPNTAATILGMPSASNVPTIVVWMVLVGTAVAPIAWFASQGWIRELFSGMRRYEARVTEGLADLPEREGRWEVNPSPKPGSEGEARSASARPPRSD